MLLAADDKMEMLASGEYSLTASNQPQADHRKSILFVKLTDSAQRALASYLRNQHACREKPQIEFAADEGRLLIPTSPPRAAAAEPPEPCMAHFKFDVSSNDAMQGKQGRFECVQHRRGGRQLLRYGQLTHRLRIHANEDVYETTKNRMAAIELQQRKNCTVQLDWSSSTKTTGHVGRKLKLTPKGLPARQDYAPRPASRLETSNMARIKSRPVNNAPPKKINPAACLVRKPLRERIVHLLAVRPHKRPELEAALKRDGIRDCDRAHVVDTLISVSTFRDNTYHLAKHAWSDVQDDWPFYAEHERQQTKKNKLQNTTSPSSNSDSGVSVTSNHSPSNQPAAGSPPQAYKRPGYFNGVDGFQTKRQRISHFIRQERSQPAASQEPDDYKTATAAAAKAKSPPPPTKPSAAAQQSPRMTPAGTQDACVSSTVLGPDEATFEPSLQMAFNAVANREPAQPYEKPKYMKDYVTITNTEQRSRYKADFSKIFEEYESVHKEVDRVRDLFAQLGESLKTHKKGSKGYAKVENDILTKYYALKSNRKYHDAKRRYEYLHEKLSHIKNLVNEYDDNARKLM